MNKTTHTLKCYPNYRRSSNGSLMDEDLLCGLNPSLYRRRYSAGASVSSREDIDDDDDDDDEFSFDYLGRWVDVCLWA